MVLKRNFLLATVFFVCVTLLLHCFNDTPEIPENPEVWMVINDTLRLDSLDVVRITTDDTLRIGVKTFMNSLIDSISVTVNDSALELMESDMIYALLRASDTGHYKVKAVAWKAEAIKHRSSLTIEVAGTRFTVTYNGNGADSGVVPVDGKNHDPGDEVVVKGSTGANGLIKAGYSFSGWNGKKDGTGKEYQPGDTLIAGVATAVLYAQWKTTTATVTFDGRGGTPATTELTVNQGDTVTVPPVLKTGCSVEKWYRDSTYTTAWIFASDKVSENVTLYVKWDVNQYKVTFNARGGTPATTELTLNYGDLATAPNPAPSNSGYTLGKWYRDSARTTEWVFATDKITGNITLHADWIRNSYEVIYNGNGSTAGSVATQKPYFGDSVTVAAKGNLVRTGYTFIEWNTAANGSGTKYAPGAKFKMGAGVVNVYAQWRNPAGMVRIPASHRGAVGVCMPWGDNDGLLLGEGV